MHSPMDLANALWGMWILHQRADAVSQYQQVGVGLLHYFIMGCFWSQTFCLLGGVIGGGVHAFSRVFCCNIMATILYRPLNMPHAAELARLNLKAETIVRSAGVAVRELRVPFLSGRWHSSCGDTYC